MSSSSKPDFLADFASRRLFLKRTGTFAVAGGSAALLIGSQHQAQGATKEETREVKFSKAQKTNFTSIQKHETDHVAFLVSALGASARPKPTFQGLAQKKFADFVTLAQTLENTGVGAYLGAAPVIDSAAYLAAAGSILTVEARHSGYLNTLLGDPITAPASDDDTNPSFDVPLTAAQVVDAAGGFIANLNGGPEVGYSSVPSPENDIAILNFALALEYLEAEFYDLNVPTFFRTK